MKRLLLSASVLAMTLLCLQDKDSDNGFVEHYNGKLVQDLKLSETESKDKPTNGHLALQDHGLPLEFRSIRNKEL